MIDSPLTPKQVAAALEVSESSIKRWCDSGKIESVKTPGGHRKISAEAVIEFVRGGNARLHHPHLLGLPHVSTTLDQEVDLEACSRQVCEALLAGNEAACRTTIWELHLAGQPLSSICDEVLVRAFEEIGDRWDCQSIEIFHERRACEISIRLIHELRKALGSPANDSPIAIGCSPFGDPYTLPSCMVELVLRQCGWNATSLGFSVPLASLAAAVQEIKPRLVWVSVSSLRDASQFVVDFNDFYQQVSDAALIAVGGRALTQPLREELRFSFHGDNLRHLEIFARTSLHALSLQ